MMRSGTGLWVVLFIVAEIMCCALWVGRRQPERGEDMSGGCEAEEDLCNDCGACGKAEVAKLEAEGHTYHCAARQVWADGICECGKAGHVPGFISSAIMKEGGQ